MAPDAPPPDGARLAASDHLPPPTVPAIDLSEPEEPAPPSPAENAPLLASPDAEPTAPPEPRPPGAGEPPIPTAAGPHIPGPGIPPLAAATDAIAPPPPTPATTDPGGTEPRGGPPRGQVWKMALVVVVFLAVVVVAFLLGKKGGGDSQDTAPPTTSTTIDTRPVDTSTWATFTDEAAGFTVKHPKDWLSLPISSAERLVLQAGAGSAAQITVRNIDSASAPEVIKQVMADASLVETPREFVQDGHPAIVYIFNTPITEDSPDPGVAVQYFVVTPTKLYTLLFVTRPPEEINRLGRTFSAVAASFDSTSDSPAPEPAATTTTPSAQASTTSTTP